jgi:hypothetical protein
LQKVKTFFFRRGNGAKYPYISLDLLDCFVATLLAMTIPLRLCPPGNAPRNDDPLAHAHFVHAHNNQDAQKTEYASQ